MTFANLTSNSDNIEEVLFWDEGDKRHNFTNSFFENIVSLAPDFLF
jgi:hypothetical protein